MVLTEREKLILNDLSNDNDKVLLEEAREVLDELIDDAILATAFEVHRSVRTGTHLLGQVEESEQVKINS